MLHQMDKNRGFTVGRWDKWSSEQGALFCKNIIKENRSLRGSFKTKQKCFRSLDIQKQLYHPPLELLLVGKVKIAQGRANNLWRVHLKEWSFRLPNLFLKTASAIHIKVQNCFNFSNKYVTSSYISRKQKLIIFCYDLSATGHTWNWRRCQVLTTSL